jgi:ribosomal protein S18 acetylase RimI-like enzyme
MSLPSISLDLPFRLATPQDAPALVDFVDYAGSGMPMLVWAELAAPGVEARAHGLELARSEDTPMSYRHSIVVDRGEGPIAGLISLRRPVAPQPISSHAPAITVPWQQLTNLACGMWHILTIAAYPEHRGSGLGTELLHIAEKLRQASGASGTSLLVADTNIGARRLYERFGFRQLASRLPATGYWTNPCNEWLLLVRPA